MRTNKRFIGHILRLLIAISALGWPTGSLGSDHPDKVVVNEWAWAAMQARSILSGVHEQMGPAGFSVAVAVGDDVVWAEGFGVADLAEDDPADANTRYPLASVSKLFAYAAAAKLYQQEKLDLDTPVQAYVPYWPKKRWNFSLRDLAAHSAGVRHYVGGEHRALDRPPARVFGSVEEAIGLFRDDPLLYQPGSQSSYSSFGINLLSAAVEGASGMDYLDYLATMFFKPMGLTSLGPDRFDQQLPNRSRNYRLENGRPVADGGFNPTYMWAAGGMCGSVVDLVRFGAMHGKGHKNFLSDRTLKMMFEPYRFTSGERSQYGFGWRVMKDPLGLTFHGHSGRYRGSRSHLAVYPAFGVTIVLCSNTEGVPAGIMGVSAAAVRPFLAQLAGHAVRPAYGELPGTYDLDFSSGGKRLSSGTMKLTVVNGRLRGTMTVPPARHAYLAHRRITPGQSVEIIGVITDISDESRAGQDRQVGAIFCHPRSGVSQIQFRIRDDAITGEWRENLEGSDRMVQMTGRRRPKR